MTSHAVARRYAAALFDVTKRSGGPDRARTDVAAIAGLLAGNDELRNVLESPAVPAQKKRAIVAAILAAAPGIGAEVGRLLVMLADRDRLALVGALAKAFDECVMREQRVVDATITTAVPIAADRQAALAAALGKAVGVEASHVRIDMAIDLSIIGGVVARVGSLVYDGSVRRQLEKMKSRLIADA
jgi:F-type H+-transporting ATPase subunit delta